MPTIANIAKINGIVISGAAAPTDRHILLGTQTASSSATLSFSGINSHRSDVLRSSFDVLEFRFTNIHPATDGTILQFQVNASGQTGFNEVMTTTPSPTVLPKTKRKARRTKLFSLAISATITTSLLLAL